MITKVFPVDSHPELEISVRCNVTILSSDTNEVRVEVTGSEELLEDVEIYEEGGVIVVKQAGQNNVISIGNMNQINIGGYGSQVIQSGGSTFINTGGAVYVNGKRVDGGSGKGAEEYVPVEIRVYSPGVPSIELDIAGGNRFVSKIALSDVKIDGQGSSVIELGMVNDLDVDVQGSIQVQAGHVQGVLNIDSQGSAQLNFSGNYEKVRVDVQGSSRIHTQGTCRGNYVVDAAGSCRVRHTGEIHGRVRKSTAGNCQVMVG